MVLPFDFLDSMAWSITAGAVLVGTAALRLRYKASSDSVEEENKKLRTGFAAGIGATGLYLLIAGLAISFIWPFGTPFGQQYNPDALVKGTTTYPPFNGGHYNVLFGGIAIIGGLVLVATATALFFNAGLSSVSYFAAVAGVYALVDAIAILVKNYTSRPQVAALGYLAFAIVGFLSIPATHSDNKMLRYLFAVFAFLFALAWLIQAALFTLGHLGIAI